MEGVINKSFTYCDDTDELAGGRLTGDITAAPDVVMATIWFWCISDIGVSDTVMEMGLSCLDSGPGFVMSGFGKMVGKRESNAKI